MDGRPRIPRLMLVTDRRRGSRSIVEVAGLAVAGGADAVQLREPDLDDSQRRALATDLRDALGGRATLLVNGDVALARDLGLGVHLPERGPGIEESRRVIGGAALVGRSVHSPEATRDSAAADYLIAGTVFPTSSKPGHPPLGLAGLADSVAASDRPVLAIGGIDAANVADTLHAGAWGVAVIGAIADASDPRAATAALRTVIDQFVERSATVTTTDVAANPTVVHVNGKPTELPAGTTIAAFLAGKGLQERLVVVELNGAILARPSFGATALAEGDRVEVVHFVGGG